MEAVTLHRRKVNRTSQGDRDGLRVLMYSSDGILTPFYHCKENIALKAREEADSKKA
jgi:hypothetical protein